jgi:hypothetical protein
MTLIALLGIILIATLAIVVGWKIIKFTFKILFILFSLLLLAAAIYYFMYLWEPCSICGLTP